MKDLKKIIFLITIVSLWLTSCNKRGMIDGELLGVQNRPEYTEVEPHGMVFIHQGAFMMGPNDQDVPWSNTAEPKMVSIDAFWMDATEITNNEYRQFVYWVKDSIAMVLAIKEGGKTDYALNAETDSFDQTAPRTYILDWTKRYDVWHDEDDQVKEAVGKLFYSDQDRILGKKELDTRLLVYEYWYVDIKQAAKMENKYHYKDYGKTGELAKGEYDGTVISYDYENFGKKIPFKKRSDIVMHVKVPIYPDTLVWIRDYTYSYNEPWARKYFWHPAFDDYPVVGVNWLQAKAFSHWRTEIMIAENKRKGIPPYEDFRLPTEAEWEYAARGDLKLALYPWGGPYLRTYQGCPLANFKPMRGMYALDGAVRTMKVASYHPNGFGLYDMAGNVAEWCEDAYDDASYVFTHDLNPVYTHNVSEKDDLVMKRKVIRGGSWKDIGWYLQCGTRSYEYLDTAKAYIGFRNVRSYLGSSIESYYGYQGY